MLKFFFLTFILLLNSACMKSFHLSGHLFEAEELVKIQRAKNKSDIYNILGSPSTISDFGDEIWFYITSDKESFAFLADKVISQKIIAVSFNKQNEIKSIVQYSEKDKNNLKIISEQTLVKGNDRSNLQKFFSNVGKFNDSKPSDPPRPRSGF